MSCSNSLIVHYNVLGTYEYNKPSKEIDNILQVYHRGTTEQHNKSAEKQSNIRPVIHLSVYLELKILI